MSSFAENKLYTLILWLLERPKNQFKQYKAKKKERKKEKKWKEDKWVDKKKETDILLIINYYNFQFGGKKHLHKGIILLTPFSKIQM